MPSGPRPLNQLPGQMGPLRLLRSVRSVALSVCVFRLCLITFWSFVFFHKCMLGIKWKWLGFVYSHILYKQDVCSHEVTVLRCRSMNWNVLLNDEYSLLLISRDFLLLGHVVTKDHCVFIEYYLIILVTIDKSLKIVHCCVKSCSCRLFLLSVLTCVPDMRRRFLPLTTHFTRTHMVKF